MSDAIELNGLRAVDLDEALCADILPAVRAAGLSGRFWLHDDGRWQFTWLHPDGSFATLPAHQLTRRWAFIHACAEFREHGVCFEPGEMALPTGRRMPEALAEHACSTGRQPEA